MKKALAATQENFESSSSQTPEYKSWHRLFKREFTKFLESLGMTGIDIKSPNHFDMSGFFKDGKTDLIWYFSVSDLRWSKDNMLIRIAQHYKDYTGGVNRYVPLNKGEAAFTNAMKFLFASTADCPQKPPTHAHVLTEMRMAAR